jgi:orotate phosphoribosyltransferase
LESVLSSLAVDTPVTSILVRGPGELSFRLASPDGYRIAGDFPPSRVLLVEDVFVTGARLFSAARALIDARHIVAGTLVIARRVNRDWGDCQAMWDRQTAQPFTWAASPCSVAADSDLLTALRAR